MLEFLRKDFALKFMSILIALSMWLYVKSNEAIKVSNTLLVELRTSSLSPDMEVLSIPKTVSVTITGEIEALNKIDMNQLQKDMNAWVDLRDGTAGENDYIVDMAIPTTLRQLQVRYDRRVSVVLERIERQEYTVSVSHFGSSKNGLEFASAGIVPNKVIVEGSKEPLRRVKDVRVMLDLANVQPGSEVELPIEVLGEDSAPVAGIKVIPQKVRVRPIFTTAAPKRMAIVSPKFVGRVPRGLHLVEYRVEPFQVMITAPNAILQTLGSIETEPVDLSALSMSGIKTVKLKPASGVKVIGANTVQVTFVIRPTQSTIPESGATIDR